MYGIQKLSVHLLIRLSLVGGVPAMEIVGSNPAHAA